MATNSAIEWTEVTWNPVTGCDRVAAGCDNCYALALAKRLVVEAGLGLAPGAAFGDEAEGWLRWCFASRDPARLTLGVERLKSFLGL